MFTNASRPNRLILPRIRSETRGWVTPKSLAACVWLIPVRVRWFFGAVLWPERRFMFSASSGVSSMVSLTMVYRFLLIVTRSEERRVGQERVSTCKYRGQRLLITNKDIIKHSDD